MSKPSTSAAPRRLNSLLWNPVPEARSRTRLAAYVTDHGQEAGYLEVVCRR
ncbi:hypothetical protein [Streptomyces spiralis]|uniref:hypothetical protein n=1 Tax=Streptomyces spiralis TaxID=66376 RepID=UPI0036D08450